MGEVRVEHRHDESTAEHGEHAVAEEVVANLGLEARELVVQLGEDLRQAGGCCQRGGAEPGRLGFERGDARADGYGEGLQEHDCSQAVGFIASFEF